jgi:N-methylhydantoinase A
MSCTAGVSTPSHPPGCGSADAQFIDERRGTLIDIGIDVGGTFTDFVFLSEDGHGDVTKVPTDPEDLAGAVMRGLERVDLRDVSSIVHGTTAALNAILQHKGAETAMVTTRGFRDQIEIGDTRRYTGGLFDHNWVRTRPYPVPHRRRFEVTERTSPTGTVEVAPDKNDLRVIADELERSGVESVAICLINSYLSAANERAVHEFLTDRLPNLHFTLSSTNPEFREYARWITAVLNASVSPLLKEYVQTLEAALKARGYAGEVMWMTSSGGLIAQDLVVEEPLRLLMGGLAGGVSASAYLAERVSAPNVATFDMGGTSSDVGFIKNFRTHVVPNAVIEAFPIALPDLEVKSIGAGGGSIAWLTDEGLIKVGPQSAGASPGPVSYGAGGTELTVTDANLVLGRLGGKSLLNGALTLDVALAKEAAERLAAKAGIADVHELAAGVIEIAVTNMYGAIREVSVERGEDPEDMVLVAFGGAGGLHAAAIAERLSMPRVVIPRDAGNFSAFGMLVADRRYDYVSSYIRGLMRCDLAEIKSRLSGMGDEGRNRLRRDGVKDEDIDITYKVGMRYQGQTWEEELILTTVDFDLSDLGRWFGDVYEDRYEFRREPEASEIVNLRVVATGRSGHRAVRRDDNVGDIDPAGALKEHRAVYFTGGFVDTPVYDRSKLASGAHIEGPAVIEEYDSTALLLPSWTAAVDGDRNLVLTRTVTA